MDIQDTFVTLTDGLITLGIGALLLAVYGSWFASYRTSKVAPVGSSLWFSLPSWAQIIAGIVISIIGAYICYRLWVPLPLTLAPNLSLFLRLIGFALTGAGVGLWFWARWSLGAMMGLSTASAAQLQVQHRLIQTGAYAIIRHPIYLAYWLVVAGLLMVYRTWPLLLILILIIASLIKRARREDQVLEGAFGAEWQQYAERTPAFIPRWR